MVAHLKAENAYTEAHLVHVQPLVRKGSPHDFTFIYCCELDTCGEGKKKHNNNNTALLCRIASSRRLPFNLRCESVATATEDPCTSVKKVYDEIISSIQETDEDIHFPWGSRYEYYVRTVKGKAYPIVCRAAQTAAASAAKAPKEEVVLDVNEVAKPLKYCSLGSFRLSPSHDVLAYSIDPSGYETYEVRFKDLRTVGLYSS